MGVSLRPWGFNTRGFAGYCKHTHAHFCLFSFKYRGCFIHKALRGPLYRGCMKPIPHGAQFVKIKFCYELHKMCRTVERSDVCQPPTLMEVKVEWSSIAPETFSLGIA